MDEFVFISEKGSDKGIRISHLHFSQSQSLGILVSALLKSPSQNVVCTMDLRSD